VAAKDHWVVHGDYPVMPPADNDLFDQMRCPAQGEHDGRAISHVAGSCLYKLIMAHGGKALRPLPAAHKETRGSSTYLNLLVRDAARRTAGTRAAAVRSIRALPHSLDLIEVETPMLRIVRGVLRRGCFSPTPMSSTPTCAVQGRVSREFTMLEVCTRLTDYPGWRSRPARCAIDNGATRRWQ